MNTRILVLVAVVLTCVGFCFLPAAKVFVVSWVVTGPLATFSYLLSINPQVPRSDDPYAEQNRSLALVSLGFLSVFIGIFIGWMALLCTLCEGATHITIEPSAADE